MRSGIWLVVVAMSLTPALDAVAKELSTRYDPIFISFIRYLSAGLMALMLAALCRESIRLRRDGLAAQLVRTALMMGAMTAFITALSMVPLADAVGGFLIAPMVATAISVLLLGEKMSLRKSVGALLSLCGAVAIMRPGLGLESGTLLALGGGVLLGGYFAASRGAAHTEDVLAAMAVQSLLGAFMVAPLALARGLPSLDWDLAFGAVVLGGISAVCHSLTILAFRRSEASVLAPFMYFNLVVAVAIGIFVFGEMPAALTWLGLAAILAGGVTTALSPDAIAWLMGRVRVPSLPALPALPAVPPFSAAPVLSGMRNAAPRLAAPRLAAPRLAEHRTMLETGLRTARSLRDQLPVGLLENARRGPSLLSNLLQPPALLVQDFRVLRDALMTFWARRGLIERMSS
ncbi:MAG: DMT family transporter [Pseudomonadota bacterium]